MFQLFCFMTGYAATKDATDWFESSCSRMMSPGLLGPVNHWCMEVLIAAAVVPGGVSVRLQSEVLGEDGG